MLFESESPASPSRLRMEFESGRMPTDVLDRPDPEALVAEDHRADLEHALALLASWKQEGIEVVTPFDPSYPSQLRTVFDYPVLLFARGHVVDDVRSVAIVGSRAVSSWGLQFARNLGGWLAEDGVTVVSGLARGVDGAAHRAALEARGRTVAVLGNGLNYIYPSEHRELQATIASTGLVLSQYLPNERPTRRSFPARNITMSAYSSITMIVEAAEKSGTRIQADAAVRHGRPLIITSQVVAETTWGRKYAEGSFDVTVVQTASEARQAADRILERVLHPAPALMPA